MNFECVRVLVAGNSTRIRVRNSPRVRGRIRSKCLKRRRRRRRRFRRRRRRHPRNSPTFRVIVLRRVASSLELAKDDEFLCLKK